MKRTIQNQLLTAFVAVALCTGALGLFAILVLQDVSEDQLTLYGDVFGGTHLMASWVARSWEVRSDMGRYLRTENPDERIRLLTKMADEEAEISRLGHQMDVADSDRQDVEALAGLERAWQAYTTWRTAAGLAVNESGDVAGVRTLYEADGAELNTAIDAAIDSVLTKKGEVAGQLERNAQRSFQLARIVAIGLSALAAGLALVIGWFLSRSIARAVGQVAAAAKGLACGDIDQHVQVSSPDELGEMAQAFRDMIAYQQDMARVAEAIASGDLTQKLQPKGAKDILGTAFQRMAGNLHALVSELEGTVRQANQLLEKNRRLHERVREAARRTTTLNEQSLRRLGADLHDGPCQALAFALLRLDVVKRDASARSNAVGPAEPSMLAGALGQHDNLSAVVSAVQDALNEIRGISSGLRLPELHPLSVATVVERAVRDHERRSGTQVRVHLDSLPVDVPLEVKIVLYRALQEALSNATRHGGGMGVSVRLWVEERRLLLSVGDHGPGFDLALAEQKGRLGLASMRERAQLLGGSFHVDTAPGEGTRVQVAWPLSSTAGQSKRPLEAAAPKRGLNPVCEDAPGAAELVAA